MEQRSDSRSTAAGNETSISLAELEDLRRRLAKLEAHLDAPRSPSQALKVFRLGRSRNVALLALAALLAGVVILHGEDAVKSLFISPAGNVGIGAPDPGQKLDVAGTVRSRTGGFQFPDGTQQGTAAVSVPSGAVVPFNLADCPAGWNEYQLAYGRFIRGIDKSGQSIDPAGRRNVNDLQDYAIPQITGSLTGVEGANDQAWPGGFKPGTNGAFDVALSFNPYNRYNGDYSPPGGVGHMATFDSKRVLPNNTAAEARPKNVSLLYCQKG
ncbi:MAG TPA: hypothetical protein VGL22_15240 [Terracidiphilus sp.]|jgi:hypothetical protein